MVTDTYARASKLGRCAIRVSALCASCAKGVQHQARTEQRHVIAVFTHGRFHACTRKTIILQHSGPDALRCAVLQHRSDAAFHRDPARATRTTQAQLAPHSRDHSLSAPVNLQLLRCEHDETDGVACGVPVAVIRLADRRPNASNEGQEWAFQREVEAALYGHGYSQQTGAVYRLLQRSGVRERALPLKKACIEQGLVTQLEFNFMYRHLSDVRSFTLIPLDALQTALANLWTE